MVGTGQQLQAISLDPANSQHILISVHMLGIFASQDSGATWQAAYAGLEPNGSILDIVFDPTNTQIVYASNSASGVYRSTDGGQTWVKMKPPRGKPRGICSKPFTISRQAAGYETLLMNQRGAGKSRGDVISDFRRRAGSLHLY